MKAFWIYTLARIGVFVVTYVVVWGVTRLWLESNQLVNLWVLLIALVISAIISLFALGGLRDNLAKRIEGRAAEMTRRIDESRRAEDVD